jgi:hypothetical protein
MVVKLVIRFDTVTGKIAIDTETEPLKERVVITRERTGVKVQYQQPPVPCRADVEAENPSMSVDGIRTFFTRVMQLNF